MHEKEYLWDFFLKYAAGESAKNDFFTIYNSPSILEKEFLAGEEALRFLQLVISPSFADLPDTRPALLFCVKGGLPSPADVCAVYKSLLQWEALSLLKHEEFPLLDALYSEIPVPPLARHFKNAFDEDEGIADSASPELKRIRGLKKSLRTRIEKKLQASFQSEDLAEKILSFREGRYVLLYKTAAKNRISGIVHGYSATGLTAYIEPQDVVALNNELLSVDDLEQREIERLLREWGLLLGGAQKELDYLIGRMAYIEILFAKARFAREYKAVFPKISADICLLEAYNPFLLLKKGRAYTMPIDFSASKECKGAIISGPNAGGKSAALKTLALFTEMMRYGLPVPARKAELPLFKELLVEMGDHQSLDNELSTFSAHLSALKNILSKAGQDTLIVIDEIAHATDPVEGEALASAVIDALLQTKAFFAISTHYRGVKVKAFSHPGIKIYATGFDKNFAPLFTLLEDTIGESYALKIAARIGLGSDILENAENNVAENQNEKEKILANIGAFESRLHNKERDLAQKERNLLKEEERFCREQQEFTQEKNLIRSKGLSAVDSELSSRLRELSQLRSQMKSDLKKAEKFLSETKGILAEEKRQEAEIARKKPKDFTIGQRVFIASLGKPAVIEDIFLHEASVRVGVFKLTLSKADLFEDNSPLNKEASYRQPAIPAERGIDLRGKLVEEALPILERSLHRALNSGVEEFSIIHGKGTGALQKAVRDFLKTVPEAAEIKFALPQDGGAGKTIVKFQ